MAIIAKSSGSNYPKQVTPAGSHVARCYGMIEVGTEESEYKGEKKVGYKVIVDFELPLETAIFREGEAEKPFVISKEYNLSFHEKATLRKDLEAWRGAPFTEAEAESFDITRLVGKPCMLNITHKKSADGTKTYANITGSSRADVQPSVKLLADHAFVFALESAADMKIYLDKMADLAQVQTRFFSP